MSLELYAMAVNAAVLLILLLAQQLHHDVAKGIAWTFGNRDDQTLSPLGARLERTVRNHVEGVAMFTPIALALVLAEQGTATTGWAAVGFVAARCVYAALYIAGVAYLRSVAWTGAIACLCLVGWPLLLSALADSTLHPHLP